LIVIPQLSGVYPVIVIPQLAKQAEESASSFCCHPEALAPQDLAIDFSAHAKMPAGSLRVSGPCTANPVELYATEPDRSANTLCA
jgi:hypothetical protein